MTHRVHHVLFLCAGNSARSIMAESLLSHWGGGRFKAYSAGSFPKGDVHPYALDLLRRLKMPVDGARSKSWDEFARPDAPTMNFVFTVCDKLAGERCPVWPGHPMIAHWGMQDPTAAVGGEAERRQAFRDVFGGLERRIRIFAGLPLEKLGRIQLKPALDAIGRDAARQTAA